MCFPYLMKNMGNNDYSEIGSDFWIHNGSSRSSNTITLPDYILNGLCATGRGALSYVIETLLRKKINKKVLLPSYICESVILPFTNHGFKCSFYDVNKDLSPNISSFKNNYDDDIGIILYHDYFGFNTSKNLYKLLEICHKKGTYIIEDITHSLLSDYPRFEDNNYLIGSIRKWEGMPSGAFIYPDHINKEQKYVENTEYTNIRKEALLLKASYIKNKNLKKKEQFLNLFQKAQKVLEKNTAYYKIDNLSKNIIQSIDVSLLTKARQKNYCLLLDYIRFNDIIQPVFYDLPTGVTPIFFPVLVEEKRDELRNHLARSSIYCPIHWPLASALQTVKNTSTAQIYPKILSLPCDQRYTKTQMERIASTINDFYKTI